MVEEKEKEAKEEKKEVEKEVEVPKELKKIVDEISKMSALDLSRLVKVLEEKFGVSASAMIQLASAPASVADAAQAPGGAPAAAAAGKTTFNVSLKAAGDKKIEVIKVVRDITGKGLKDSKDLVDAVEKGPQVLKENVKTEEAEEMREKLSAAGATVELI